MIKVKELLIIAFIGFFLTTILTWPFLLNLKTFYDVKSDYPLEGWKLWYNFFSISTSRIFNQTSYFNSDQFYFYPFSFAYSDNVFVPGLIFSVIYTLSKSLILSVNLYTFLTFVLTFTSSFFTFRYFVKNSYASVVGATIFTFNPLTFAHFPVHIQLMNKFFLPPLFLYSYKFFTKATLKDSFLFYLFFTLNALSSTYYFIFSLIFIPLLAIPITVYQLFKKDKVYWIKLLKYSLLGILFVPILVYFNFPYLEFSIKEIAIRSLEVNAAYSANLIDWITPHPKNNLYQGLFNYLDAIEHIKNANYTERVLFLNVTPIILFILGLWQLIKKSKRLFFLLVYLILSIFLLTFGPYFSILHNSTHLFNLPYLYLYQLLPFLQGIRVPSRFQFIFYIIFALVTAYGVSLLLNKFKSGRLYVSLALLFLISIICLENQNSYLEYFNLSPPAYLQSSKLFNELSLLKNKITLHLPAYTPSDQNVADGLTYFIWLSQTQENMFNGYSGYFPQDWRLLIGRFKDSVDLSNIKILKALGIQYLIIHKDLLDKNLKINLADEEKLIIFENQNVKILNLDKINIITPICSLDKDFIITQGVLTINSNSFFGISLQNKNNCYLVNKYENRYLEYTIIKDNNKQKAHLILPLIIEPEETVILSELTHNLKVN